MKTWGLAAVGVGIISIVLRKPEEDDDDWRHPNPTQSLSPAVFYEPEIVGLCIGASCVSALDRVEQIVHLP